MLIALLSDIHANREAYEAVLDAAEGAGAERYVLLGDIVGYGADPEWCVTKTMELAEQGAVVLRGNHDEAVTDLNASFNSVAQIAIEWTRNQLGQTECAFLDGLPFIIEEEDRLYVHATANDPERWKYLLNTSDAHKHMDACHARVSFCGHVHVPMLYGTSFTGKVIRFPPVVALPVPLLAQHRWVAVMGAVGQPRDGYATAAFGLYDTERSELSFRRVPYDNETAARKIREAGLPDVLADRLIKGR
ncbi:metallophosphoesterase family protein [Microvirga sp. W0021]|uniref:Metallophosphoesterase family protein n=1 Tax=Hohaiivirga grylli TaxID=3133970 RepID=A0ABV0BFX4_9HYPH